MFNDDRLHITLPAQPDSLPIVRRAIVAHAEKLGIARAGIADLKTVVSEACANVVRHAYEEQDGAGTLEVDLDPGARGLSMVVRDFGGGIRPLSFRRSAHPAVGPADHRRALKQL